MNEMQKEISNKLIPILEESPKDDHTDDTKNSNPEDLAPQNGHEKELAEKETYPRRKATGYVRDVTNSSETSGSNANAKLTLIL